MVLWQEAKGIQQNKTGLCSYPAFHAHTEVTQDAIREMSKSVKNPEEMNTNVSVGSQGLFHLFDLKAWLEMCVVFRISCSGIFQGTICFISCRFRVEAWCRQYSPPQSLGWAMTQVLQLGVHWRVLLGPRRSRSTPEVPLPPSWQGAVPAPLSYEQCGLQSSVWIHEMSKSNPELWQAFAVLGNLFKSRWSPM